MAIFLTASLSLGFVSPSEAVRNTGTINFSGTEFSSGLNEVARFVGKYQASTDADGYDSNGDVQLQIVRPEGGTIVAAYLTSLSSLDDGAYDPPATTLDGETVTYSYRTGYGGYANHLADVTTIVNDFLTGTSPTDEDYTSPFSGATDSDLFDIAATLETTVGLTYNSSSTQYQGLMLTVVFEDTTLADDSTVIIMFGNAAASPAQETNLSFTELTSDAPPESWMAVGIAWSYSGEGEVSTIEASTNISARPDCNANPSAAGCITKTAGGYQTDGQTSPLQLITYGGVGDDRANGFGTVTQTNDDELYNIDGLLKTGASEVTLYSANTSANDNFGMLTVYLPLSSNPEITFDANGGTGSMPNQSSATAAAIDTNAFERTDFSFAGWKDSTGKFYLDEAEYSFSSSTTMYAQWSAEVSASLSSLDYSADTDVPIDATVTGASLASDSSRVYEASISATSGTFTLTDATLADCDGDGTLTEAATGVYCSPGKTDVTDVSELKFRSNTTGSLNTVLDSVTFNIADSETSDLSLSISEVSSSQDVYKFGDHYYEYVADSGVSATAAETAAEAKSFFGLSGYLVNITSQAENDFVANEAQADDIWIGASDRDSEGNWAWLGGPEEGQVFFKDPDDGIAGAATYNLDYFNAWASAEPNDVSGEDYAVTNYNSAQGEWNDLGATNTGASGYFVEYGDDSETVFLSTASSTTTVSASSTPTPYTGPIIHGSPNGENKEYSATGTESAIFEGERLGTVTKAFVDGDEVEIIELNNSRLEVVVPEGLAPGTYDLYIQSSIGNLTYLDALVITGTPGTTCSGESTSYWTTRISDTQAKVYIKCPALDAKIRILHQTGGSGEYDVPFVKTITSVDDSSLVVNEFGTYIVRTIDLDEINRIRIRIGDDEVWKVRYNR